MQKLISALGARWFQFAAIPLIVFAWFWWTDPSGGADTMLRVQLWAQAFLVTGVSYLICKAMLGSASSEDLYEQSLMGNYGAGIAYLGICLQRAFTLVGLLIFFALVQK